MIDRARIPTAVLVSALAIGCQPATRSVQMIDGSSRVWSDGAAVFQFAVSGGQDRAPLMCVFSIQNRADRTMTFPKPMIMPSAGKTNKNSVLVIAAEGHELAIEGPHYDFFEGERPAVALDPGSTASWPFSLDYHFPGLWKDGQYRVAIRYFADGGGPGIWSGNVEMEPVTVSVAVMNGWAWVYRLHG